MVEYPSESRTNCWDGGDGFTELEFVEDGGFTSGIKANLYIWDQVAFTKERGTSGTMRMPGPKVRNENVE